MALKIAGIDEAGRGPVVGPMVIAAVVADNSALVGVRDSKKLTPAARTRLYGQILRAAECVNYIVIEPHIIDHYVEKSSLNVLELDYTAKLIEMCPADLYYVDSPDINPERYGAALSFLTGRRVEAMHKGERVPQVAAASIVAKVVRNALIDILKREVGNFGSGYPSDPLTRKRLADVPKECIRSTWRTKTI